MNILVATDGSPSAKAAMALLNRLPLPAETSICVLGVVHIVKPAVAEHEPLIGAKVRELLAEVLAEERAAVRGRLEEACTQLATAGRRVTTLTREGEPADEIVRAAAELHTDLLVLGSRGLGPLKSLWLGGVSRRAVRHAPCSVLLVKPPAAAAATQTRDAAVSPAGRLDILLATDGSPASDRAAHFLEGLRFGGAATLTILVVIPRFAPSQTLLPPPAEAAERESAELLLAALREQLSTNFADTTTAIRVGDASQEILAAAAEEHADMIVVGSRGLSAVQAFFLGSVVEKLLHRAPCAVLVVRPARSETGTSHA